MPSEEHFSNPLAPPDHHPPSVGGGSTKHALKNDDFRKLLTTPRVGGSVSSTRRSTDETPSFTHHRPGGVNSASGGTAGGGKPGEGGANAKAGGGKARRPYHHQHPKKGDGAGGDDDEDDQLGEILKNYRDRAKERRVGEGKGGVGDADILQLTSGYRALPRDARSATDAAERRKQLIQESKYLGGDMEHTHLVKGLDYSLLQKVRSEIVSKEEDDDLLESSYNSAAKKDERQIIQQQIKHNMAKGIYRVLFADEADGGEQPVKRNELFAARRMAYVIELDDDFSQSDLPTTLIRSKADCPVDESTTNLSTNDMVIQKLTQVLSYLRTDTKRKKKEKLEMSKEDRDKLAGQNIYDDAGDYVPTVKRGEKGGSRRSTDAKSGGARDRNYFDEKKRTNEDTRQAGGSTGGRYGASSSGGGGGRGASQQTTGDVRLSQGWAPADIALQQTGTAPADAADKAGVPAKTDRDPLRAKDDKHEGISMMAAADDDSYAECYPGGLGDFAGNESDDEGADYSKMDMGNKKGPIRRWDFDTDEQYEEYMSGREAMPKAAFQFGVKMDGGRKTRKMGQGGGANAGGTADKERIDKMKLDKEWDQISRILAKRKTAESGGDAKKAKK